MMGSRSRTGGSIRHASALFSSTNCIQQMSDNKRRSTTARLDSCLPNLPERALTPTRRHRRVDLRRRATAAPSRVEHANCPALVREAAPGNVVAEEEHDRDSCQRHELLKGNADRLERPSEARHWFGQFAFRNTKPPPGSYDTTALTFVVFITVSQPGLPPWEWLTRMAEPAAWSGSIALRAPS